MKFELKEYSLWGTIGRGINMYFVNLPFLFLVGIIANMPGTLYLYFKPVLMTTPFITENNFYIPFIFLVILSGGFASGIIIHVLINKYLNTDPSAPYYTGTVPSLILPLFGLAFVISLGLSAVPAAGFMTVFTEDNFILFITPSLFLFICFCVSFNVLVIERKGIFKSLLRSLTLTRRRRWKAFWLFVFVFFTCLGFYLLLIIPFSFIIGIAGMIEDQLVWDVFPLIAYAILSPIFTCVSIVFYLNMKIEKEGFNIEYLADHFSLAAKE
ncbi:MAG: hypothetical protein GY754_37950 [bacterium]|nr:hypothetical protein [bacterium]